MSYPKVRPYGGGSTPGLGTLTVDRQILRLDGAPWQWLGVSFFKGCKLFEQGGAAAVDPFIDAYPGARVFRIWDYTPAKDWGAEAWEPSPPDVWIAFLAHMASRGKFVSRTALTDEDPARIDPAKRTIESLTAAGCKNLLHEAGNEPNTHKGPDGINTHALIDVMQASGLLWSTGDYENSQYWRGTHGNYHPARTNDFARRAHDAFDYFHGGGPNHESEPATHVSWINDEPAKLQDVPRPPADAPISSMAWAAWRSHFAASLMFGGGFTDHTETGKYGKLPTADEQKQWALAIEVASLIAADAALGPYRRLDAEDEPGQTEDGRTYVIGNYMVRCQQSGVECPEPGWTPLDNVGVLFTR